MRSLRRLTARIPIWGRISVVIGLLLAAVIVSSMLLGAAGIGRQGGGHAGQGGHSGHGDGEGRGHGGGHSVPSSIRDHHSGTGGS